MSQTFALNLTLLSKNEDLLGPTKVIDFLDQNGFKVIIEHFACSTIISINYRTRC